MKAQPQFWTVRIPCSCEQVSLVEEAFSENSAAISVLPSGKEGIEIVEILCDIEPDAKTLTTKLGLLQALSATPQSPLTFTVEPVGNLDWIKEVAGQFEPLPIARWTIFGAAFRDKVKTDHHKIQIDATSAFGTGEHPTTRGCLLMLDEMLKRYPKLANNRQARMLDVGCGSGILAMAFSMATGAQAFGVDMDEDSIAIAQENLKVNDLAKTVRFEVGTGYAHPDVRKHAPYDLIMANIFADPLCALAKDLKNHLRPGGLAILSGILNHQADAVLSAHRQQGLTLLKRKRLGEWSVLALTRPMRAS